MVRLQKSPIFVLGFEFSEVVILPKMTEITITDTTTGEVLVEKTVWGARSKGGWVMFYQQKGQELIAKAPSPAVLKIFMYLAMGQNYEGGMKTTKADIQRKLGLSKPTVMSSFRWLKDNFIVHEWRVDGCCEFMINPQYVCIGKFDERMKMWNQRWDDFKPMYASRQYHRKKKAQQDSSSAS